MTIEIRPIEPHQIAETKKVILSVARNIYEWPEPLEEIIRKFDERGELGDIDDFGAYRPESHGLFLVAMDGERVVGTGAVRRVGEDTAELKRLWLLEEYHGKGIGYRMVQTLLQFARAAGYRRMRLQSDIRSVRALRFYERVGFHVIGCQGEDPEDVCMEMGI